MKHYKLCLTAAAMALCLGLTACGEGDTASSGSSLGTLAEGSNLAVNGSNVSGSPESDEEQELHMMTVDETIDFFKSLDPALLGLDKKMSDYQVYPSDKAIPVDGMPCMKVTAYASTESGNSPEATFLVARDGTAIYTLTDGEAVKLDIDLG